MEVSGGRGRRRSGVSPSSYEDISSINSIRVPPLRLHLTLTTYLQTLSPNTYSHVGGQGVNI